MPSQFIQDTVLRFRPWSHSKVDLAEKCGGAFEFKYVRRFKSIEQASSRVGTAVHSYIENRLEGADETVANERAEKAVVALTTFEREILEERKKQSEAYIARTMQFRTKEEIAFEGYEVRLAIRPDGSPCDYEDKDALMRGSIDHLLEMKSGLGIILDTKSGRVKTIDKYVKQLDTYKVLAARNRRHIKALQGGVHHVQDQQILWQRRMPAHQVHNVMLPWLIRRIEQAAAALEGFPRKPTTLCSWCDYHLHCDEGKAFVSPEDAARARAKSDARNLPKKPRIKKDGTPYKTRESRNIDTEHPDDPPLDVESMFSDTEIIL